MELSIKITVISVLIFTTVVLLLKPFTFAQKDAINRLNGIKNELRGNRRPKRMSFISNLFAPKDKSVTEKASIGKRFAEAVDATIKDGNPRKPLTKDDKDVLKLLAVADVDISVWTFTLIRLAIGLLMAVIAFAANMVFFAAYFGTAYSFLFSLVFGMMGTLLPKTLLRMMAEKRRNAIVSSLTDTIDLLAISVEAGLGYDAAIMSIYENNKSPAMCELVRTMEDINFGMSKKDAYTSLAARCNSEEVSMFANNMAQADALGVSIVNVLKSQAKALRTARYRKAEAQIQKASIKMTLPLVLCVFPNMFLILLGPAVYNISVTL